MTCCKGYILVLFSFVNVTAQVSVSDSMALVDLYNSCGGNSWNSKNGWLTSSVISWHGVTIVNNRVSELALPNNNLVDTLPDSFCQLTELKYLYFSGNHLHGQFPSCFGNLTLLNTIDLRGSSMTGAVPAAVTSFLQLADLLLEGNDFSDLPNLTSLPELANVNVIGNLFSFDDLKPNVSILNFTYAPQDTLGFLKDTTVELRDTFFLWNDIPGNAYQWYFNGDLLSNNAHYQVSRGDSLEVRYALFPDSGIYISSMSDAQLPGLILFKRIAFVHIHDNRLNQSPQLISARPECGNPLVKLIALSEVVPVSLSLISGNAVLQSDTVLQPFTPGFVVVRMEQGGNDYYKPIVKDTTFQILEVPQQVFRERMLPLDPEDLFRVRYSTNNGFINLVVVNPALDTFRMNAVYEIPSFKEFQQGTYQFFIQTNGCSWYSESFDVQLDKTIRQYELLSPNGDGKNDVFLIGGLWNQKENLLQVYNAYKQLVFEKENYQNDWDGEMNPDGPYYYTLTLKSGEKVHGSFQLKRQ